MTEDQSQALRQMLVEDEGYRQYPYNDTTGHLTIGIGRNLTSNGISLSEAYTLLNNDIAYFTAKLEENIPSFDELNAARKIVLVNMCFNLGLKGLLEFRAMLNAIADKDWDAASREITFSKAAVQTGHRYERLAQIMKTGLIQGG
jgi:lysozyme